MAPKLWKKYWSRVRQEQPTGTTQNHKDSDIRHLYSSFSSRQFDSYSYFQLFSFYEIAVAVHMDAKKRTFSQLCLTHLYCALLFIRHLNALIFASRIHN